MIAPAKPLIERDDALGRLNKALDEATREGGRTVLLRGEAGIGKTSLLRAWTAAAVAQHGAQVYWGGCEALFTPRPLGPVLDIAAALGPSVLEAARQQRSAPEMFASMAGWLSTPATAVGGTTHRARVSVLVVEDAHWADHLSLDFLKFIGRRIHQWPALLLMSYRDDEVGPMHPLTQVLGDLPSASSEAIDLLPLSCQALATLSGYTAARAAELMNVTGGNPFFATEVVASSNRRPAAAVPSTVAAAVLARAQRVGAVAMRVLQAVSLEPGSMEQAVVLKLVGDESSQGIEECLEAGLLRWQDRGVAFRHELARRVIEQSMSPLRRRDWHAQVYALLRNEADELVDRMAYHAKRADDHQAILQTAPAAAERALALGAHREAAAHFRTALDHANHTTPDQRAHLLERWAAVAVQVGAPLNAQLQARRDALALRQMLQQPDKVGLNLRSLARLHLQAGDLAQAWHELNRAIALLEELPPGEELAEACSQYSSMHMVANEWTQAQAWGLRAIELANTLGLHGVEASALNSVGSCLADAGDEQGFTMLERSLALSFDHGLHASAARAWLNGGEAAVRNRLLEQGERWLRDGLAYAHRYDLDRWLPHLAASLSHALIAQGRSGEAAALAAEYLPKLAPDLATNLTLRAVAPTVAILHEGPDAAGALTELWATAKKLRHPDELVPIALARAEAAWMHGDYAAVRDVVAQTLDACAALTAWDRGELACWDHRCGGAQDMQKQGPMAAPFEAEMAGNFNLAAQLLKARGMPRHQAWVLTLKNPHDDPQALAQAIAIFDRIGAAACAQHARRLARKHVTAGLKGIRTGPRATARSNGFGLTPRERQIASHLAQGRSNLEIAAALSRSERTVENHVATVLNKLSVRRRQDVAALLRDAGELDDVLALTMPGALT